MYVKAIIILCCIIGGLLLYLFLRGSSNGSGIQDDSDIIDRIKDNNKQSEDINSKLKDNSKSRRDITEQIESDNESAGTGIDDALEILRRAKDRSNTK